MAFLILDRVATISSTLIHVELRLLFWKIQVSSPVITWGKPMCDYACRILRKAFALLTRFLRSSAASMYGIGLKWKHWTSRDLVMSSQTGTLRMCKSSLNIRSEENETSRNLFKTAVATLSSGLLPGHGSFPTETRPILNSWGEQHTKPKEQASSPKHNASSLWISAAIIC
jgi:hypothetical protein